MEIEVASINDHPAEGGLTQVEVEEARRTFYVKRAGAAGAMGAMGWMLLRHPGGLLRGLWRAMGLAGGDVRRMGLGVFYWAEALILLRWMERRGLTHLHVHFATPASTVGLIGTAMAPVGFSMTVHGPDEFYDVTGYSLAEKIRAARFVVCISFFAQSQTMKLSPGDAWGKFEIGRLGVDTAHFAARPFRGVAEPFRILCVGRLAPTKGQRILIEAVALLIGEGRAVEAQLVGDGPERGSLEAMVRERGLEAAVRFAGSVNQDRIQEFYRAADVFALASFAEGIPVVLMEAMAMEIPCVATRINGIPELIEDGVDGLLVAPSDVLGLAGSIVRLMEDPGLREAIGKAGRLRVQREYELSDSVDRLQAIFRRRLEGA
jgi:colanic acid/amylovoran biosynthesis glycosyltransferase